MIIRQRCYTKKELAEQGNALYELQVRAQVEENYFGKIVAIDIDSGGFEVDDDTLVASDRLLARYPNAQTWFVRIGSRGVHRFGWHGKAEMA